MDHQRFRELNTPPHPITMCDILPGGEDDLCSSSTSPTFCGQQDTIPSPTLAPIDTLAAPLQLNKWSENANLQPSASTHDSQLQYIYVDDGTQYTIPSLTFPPIDTFTALQQPNMWPENANLQPSASPHDSQLQHICDDFAFTGTTSCNEPVSTATEPYEPAVQAYQTADPFYNGQPTSVPYSQTAAPRVYEKRTNERSSSSNTFHTSSKPGTNSASETYTSHQSNKPRTSSGFCAHANLNDAVARGPQNAIPSLTFPPIDTFTAPQQPNMWPENTNLQPSASPHDSQLQYIYVNGTFIRTSCCNDPVSTTTEPYAPAVQAYQTADPFYNGQPTSVPYSQTAAPRLYEKRTNERSSSSNTFHTSSKPGTNSASETNTSHMSNKPDTSSASVGKKRRGRPQKGEPGYEAYRKGNTIASRTCRAKKKMREEKKDEELERLRAEAQEHKKKDAEIKRLKAEVLELNKEKDKFKWTNVLLEYIIEQFDRSDRGQLVREIGKLQRCRQMELVERAGLSLYILQMQDMHD